MKLLVIGATSAIAYETARLFAAERAELFLVGRNADRLKAVQDDLRVRGARQVDSFVLDLADLKGHQAMIDAALAALGGLDGVLIAHGTLSDQAACQRSAGKTLDELAINCLSAISILTIIANYFEQQRRGCIAVITSVAGDRGRQSNYVYGTAKGALSIFLQGLRNRLYKAGVAVVTIKPGYVDTPMTAAIKKNALFADPQAVGKTIHRAMKRGTDVVYVPWFWYWIMLLIRNIPERVFKRLKL
jgi:decaprenylphospho-beta-D-erythro-pentofuranosid-2-ulose 2-reductase